MNRYLRPLKVTTKRTGFLMSDTIQIEVLRFIVDKPDKRTTIDILPSSFTVSFKLYEVKALGNLYFSQKVYRGSEIETCYHST